MQHLLLQTQTDERLARLSANGHAAAFTVLVERHRRSLYRVALNLVPVGEADDVMQQSLLQAWVALQGGAEIRHLRGWLHQIVRHVAIRSRAAPLPYAELDEQATVAVAVRPDADTRVRMRETLASVAALPEKQRMALLRCAVQGESQAAVATELGTTETGVRQLLYRARSTLRAAATALLPLPIAQWAAASMTFSAGAGAAGGIAGVATGSKLAAAAVVVAIGSGAAVSVDTHRNTSHAGTRSAATIGSVVRGATRRVMAAPAASGAVSVALSGPSATASRRPARSTTPRSSRTERRPSTDSPQRRDKRNGAHTAAFQPTAHETSEPRPSQPQSDPGASPPPKSPGNALRPAGERFRAVGRGY